MQRYSEQTITDSYGANEEGYAKMKWEGNLLFSRCEKCRLKWKQIIVKPLAASMTMNGAVHVNKSFICLYNFFFFMLKLFELVQWLGGLRRSGLRKRIGGDVEFIEIHERCLDWSHIALRTRVFGVDNVEWCQFNNVSGHDALVDGWVYFRVWKQDLHICTFTT